MIACTGSCLEEAGGRGGIYVSPDDVDGYIDNARRLLDDSYLCSKMVEYGRRHIKRFTNTELAKLTMASYNKAIVSTIF